MKARKGEFLGAQEYWRALCRISIHENELLVGTVQGKVHKPNSRAGLRARKIGSA